jgi:hypothetical protein
MGSVIESTVPGLDKKLVTDTVRASASVCLIDMVATAQDSSLS